MTPIDFSQVSILIVDDDELSQSFLEGVLRNIGCQHVLVASDAQQAIELMQRHRPDFVTLDIYMPDVDGWALLKQIRKISRLLPEHIKPRSKIRATVLLLNILLTVLN